MASDILLVLQSDHRQLEVLADRCSRSGRGLEDPQGDLRAALQAHVTALLHEVLPAGPQRNGLEGFTANAEAMLADLPEMGVVELVSTARSLIRAEQQEYLPVAQRLGIDVRRRTGRAFRIRRDAALRARGFGRRAAGAASQSELYERARRAGISQRSKMTHAQLLRALEATNRAAPRR